MNLISHTAMEVVPYDISLCGVWDTMVRTTRTGTFLFERSFMGYHADRFADASLLFYYKGKVQGLFPANYDVAAQRVCSHQGLTYGGLLTPKGTTYQQIAAMMHAAIVYYKQRGDFLTLCYTPTPYIYHTHPAQEDLYWLSQHRARVGYRSISSVLALGNDTTFSYQRRRGVRRGQQAGLSIQSLHGQHDVSSLIDSPLAALWDVLQQMLKTRHNAIPTHSLAEIYQLWQCFPQQICPYIVCDMSGEVVAGVVLFLTQKVVHVQYIAASERGREVGALDYLFDYLLHHKSFTQSYFDFGISTEDHGRYLNAGLLSQKEGFGASAICYDTYLLTLTDYTDDVTTSF